MWNRWRSRDFTFPKFKSVEDDGADPVFVFLGGVTSVFIILLTLFLLVRQFRSPQPSGRMDGSEVTGSIANDDSLEDNSEEVELTQQVDNSV